MGTFLYNLLTNFATENRGWFVTFFVLPLSFSFEVWFNARRWFVMKLFSAPKLHQQRVKGVVDQILAWRKLGGVGRLCTGRGGWESITLGNRDYKRLSTPISVNMFDILELDEAAMWVKVEPLVSMGQLSHYLISKGYTIPVLPELDDLTVGGLYMGVGIETSSHKYGLFNDTVLEAEVVCSDGRVLICNKTQNRDLFDALPWSYGTLGFLLSVKISVIPCKPFVRIEYIPVSDLKSGTELFASLSCGETAAAAPDFVEALGYSLNEMVVMPASFVDKVGADGVLNRIGRWYKPWFYKHVESFLKNGKSTRVVEYIPIRDYFHRHTKSIFWEMADIVPFGNHWLYRWVLGWAVPPKVSFLKMTQTATIKEMYETQHVIQDMLVPISKMAEALQVFDREFSIYPLWYCPYRAYDRSEGGVPHRGFLRRPENVGKGTNHEMYVDLGAYGVPQAVRAKDATYNCVQHTRNVERYVLGVRGYQMLYAISYLERKEFREMFDHTHLDEMKKKYDPSGAFPEVFEKTCKIGQNSFKKD